MCLSIVFACTLFNPLDAYGPPKSTSTPTSIPDGAIDDGGIPESDGNTCQPLKWPAPPATETTGTGVPFDEIVFAAETLDLDTPQDASTPVIATGFDLDGVCTCPGPPSCTPPSGAKPTCDQDGGVDTGGTELISTLAQLSQGNLDFNSRIRLGENSLLFRIRSYNGGANDHEVELAVFSSGGTEGAQTGTPQPPKFDGNDPWTVDSRSLFAGTAPPYVPLFADTRAYVTDDTLVASIDFPLRLSSLTVTLSGAILTAKIVRNGDTFRLINGRLVGRWTTREFLTSLDTTKDPFDKDGGGVCGSSSFYQDLKKKICAGVDIVGDPKKDNTSAPCDALAITVLFTAGPAKLGNVFDMKPALRRCGDTYSDDCVR